jgi:two-component system chemotaxis sensor kinase CheA
MDRPEFVQDFILESTDSLRKVEQDLLALERNPDSGTVSRVFRALHSIKGSAAFLGLPEIEKSGHLAETLLDLIRRGKATLTADGIDALLKCVDTMNRMVQSPDLGKGTDLAPIVGLIEPMIAGVSAGTPSTMIPTSSITARIPDSPPVPSQVAVVAKPQSLPPAVPDPPKPPQSEDMETPPAIPLGQSIGFKLPEREQAASEDEKLMRVRVRFLDDLLQLTGNMVMARNQLLSKYNFGNDPSFLTLSQCVTQVHKTIVQTRMQPIGTLFDRCERQVRDLCQAGDRRRGDGVGPKRAGSLRRSVEPPDSKRHRPRSGNRGGPAGDGQAAYGRAQNQRSRTSG